MRVLILHGAHSSPERNWFPWLGRALAAEGVRVDAPALPTPENAHPMRWYRALEAGGLLPDAETVLVAHSLGPLFALHLLEEHPVAAGFFVAPFLGELRCRFDEHNRPFFKEFAMERVWKHLPYAKVYFSDNDPFVPEKESALFAEILSAEHELVPGAGHLNEEAGYAEFPLLLADLVRFLHKDF